MQTSGQAQNRDPNPQIQLQVQVQASSRISKLKLKMLQCSNVPVLQCSNAPMHQRPQARSSGVHQLISLFQQVCIKIMRMQCSFFVTKPRETSNLSEMASLVTPDSIATRMEFPLPLPPGSTVLRWVLSL